MRKLLQPLEDLLSLFYPHLCVACEWNAPLYGESICTSCQATLPEATHHLWKDNPFTEKFWGRVPLESGAALYLFTKESRVQHLIHNLKYQGKKQIGVILGKKFGHTLKQSPHFMGVEVIIPVPLHPHKELLRGYNQSELFAIGLSESMGRPYLKNGLLRRTHSESQTRKSRMERIENVQEVFIVKNAKAVEGKHVLLVDDVLTTGSTLEACAKKILEIPGTKVSLATIAMAMH